MSCGSYFSFTTVDGSSLFVQISDVWTLTLSLPVFLRVIVVACVLILLRYWSCFLGIKSAVLGFSGRLPTKSPIRRLVPIGPCLILHKTPVPVVHVSVPPSRPPLLPFGPPTRLARCSGSVIRRVPEVRTSSTPIGLVGTVPGPVITNTDSTPAFLQRKYFVKCGGCTVVRRERG